MYRVKKNSEGATFAAPSEASTEKKMAG